MVQGTANVATGNRAVGGGTLNGAAVMAITLSNVHLFAGVGAALNDNNTATPTDDVIDLGAAIGFQHHQRQRGAGAGAPGNG
jgi:hypothetical protein